MAGLKLAVTGATGFVGRHFVDGLKQPGITLLARRPDRVENPQNYSIVAGALEDETALAELVEGKDCIVHCAGLTSAISARDYNRVNGAATARLAKLAVRAGVARFVLVSSMAAREPRLSAYGESKRAGESELRRLAGDMDWVILRPPAVYGPGDKGTLPLIKQLTAKTAYIPGNVRSRFSLIHVSDFAAAMVYAMKIKKLSGGIFELHDGRGQGYGWADLARLAGQSLGYVPRLSYLPRALADLAGYAGLGLARVSGRRPFASPGKIRELYHEDWVARHNLLNEACDWLPKVEFADGFRTTVQWYRNKGWL